MQPPPGQRGCDWMGPQGRPNCNEHPNPPPVPNPLAVVCTPITAVRWRHPWLARGDGGAPGTLLGRPWATGHRAGPRGRRAPPPPPPPGGLGTAARCLPSPLPHGGGTLRGGGGGKGSKVAEAKARQASIRGFPKHCVLKKGGKATPRANTPRNTLLVRSSLAAQNREYRRYGLIARGGGVLTRRDTRVIGTM